MNTLLFQQITTPDDEVRLAHQDGDRGACWLRQGQGRKIRQDRAQGFGPSARGDSGALWRHAKNTFDTRILKKFDQDPDLPKAGREGGNSPDETRLEAGLLALFRPAAKPRNVEFEADVDLNQ